MVRDMGVDYSEEGERLWEGYLNALGAEGWQLVSSNAHPRPRGRPRPLGDRAGGTTVVHVAGAPVLTSAPALRAACRTGAHRGAA